MKIAALIINDRKNNIRTGQRYAHMDNSFFIRVYLL